MFRNALAALALVALAAPAHALDVQVTTDKVVYQTKEIVLITATVQGAIPQSRVKFAITGVNDGVVWKDPQHYGGRKIKGSGVVSKKRRVQGERNFGGGINSVTHEAEKGTFTITAFVFDPPGKGGASASATTQYDVP